MILITCYYEITCSVCEKEFQANLGGLPVEDLEIVERNGWLVLYDDRNPYAAICPACWDQIVDRWQTLGAGKGTK